MDEEVSIDHLKQWFPEVDFTSITSDDLAELNEQLDEARMNVIVSWGDERFVGFPRY